MVDTPKGVMVPQENLDDHERYQQKHDAIMGLGIRVLSVVDRPFPMCVYEIEFSVLIDDEQVTMLRQVPYSMVGRSERAVDLKWVRWRDDRFVDSTGTYRIKRSRWSGEWTAFGPSQGREVTKHVDTMQEAKQAAQQWAMIDSALAFCERQKEEKS